MGTAQIGYTIGIFGMSFAIAVILQFILNKLAFFKRRPRASYGVAYVFSLFLIAASSDILTSSLLGAALLSLALFFVYKRDVAKLSK